MDHKILSICIPTYNRAVFLAASLQRIFDEYACLGTKEEVEILISDNLSNDHTQDVVRKFIESGLPINYIRNQRNIGMDGNFVQCFKKASSRYILVLGDDDYLIKGGLQRILDAVRGRDFGLIHLCLNGKAKKPVVCYNDAEVFLKDISHVITYISSNIVAKKFVEDVDFEKYMGTFLPQVPLYITAALKSPQNLMINERIFEEGADIKNSGGYNFLQVFVTNYLWIRNHFLKRNSYRSILYYEIEKYNLFHLLLPFIYNLLLRKNDGRFETRNAWKILFRHYGLRLYSYPLLFRHVILQKYRRSKNRVK
ncbi:MAG: glycosyltransferase family 2 protein [Niabella sp.]